MRLMKFFAVFCGIYFLVPVSAHAQSKIIGSFNGGISILSARDTKLRTPEFKIETPSGRFLIRDKPDEFLDHYKTGFNIGVGFGYFLDARQRVALHGNLHYTTHPFDGDRTISRIREEGGALLSQELTNASIRGPSLNVLAISLNFMVNPGASDLKVVPYLIGGVSWFRSSSSGIIWVNFYPSIRDDSILRVIPSENTSRFGLNFGGGIRLNLTDRFGIFIAVRYNLIMDEDYNTRYIPLNIGVFIR